MLATRASFVYARFSFSLPVVWLCMKRAMSQREDKASGRAHWTTTEESVLIQIWKERISDLRGVKRNGKVYAEMTAALADFGIIKTRHQVHSKIENLGNKFRKINKNKTTGSSAIKWPHYWEVARLLGKLPANDPTRVVESNVTVDELVNRMERGSPEPNEADFQDWVFDDDPAEPAESELETSSAPCMPAPVPLSTTTEQGLACSQVPVASTSQSVASPACPPNRLAAEGQKRKRTSKRDGLLDNILQEQRALRASFEEARKEELQLQHEHLNFQKESAKREQELIDVLKGFFNQPH